MNYMISEEAATAILQYLVKKPFEEVSTLVNHLMSLQKVNIVQPTSPVTEGGDSHVQSTESQSEENNASQQTVEGSNGEKQETVPEG